MQSKLFLNGARQLTFGCRFLVLLLAFWAPAHAATVSGLYEAVVPVSDRGEKARDEGFRAALGVVAVRVSGVRDAAGRLEGSSANARRYVQRFGYTGTSMLQVGFDAEAVNRLLIEAGLPVWGRERPVTLICMQLQEGGAASWIPAAGAGSERQAIEAAAVLRGLPLVWPAMTPDEQLLLSSASSPAQLKDLARRYRADGVLLGRGARTAAGVGAAHWAFQSESGASEADGSFAEGIDLAADTLARLYGVSGAAVSETLVQVSGITGLKAYADTLNYLETLTLVRSVAVDQVAGDTVQFRLTLRGDPVTLRRAIALDQRLTSLAPADEVGTGPAHLSFRYQP